jgi:hypothetical protein
MCLVSMQAMEELGHFQHPGIVHRSSRHGAMLKHEVLAVDEWHNNGPQDLISVSRCIKIPIDKMQLCLLSVAYACPYHNPTATLTSATPYTCSVLVMPVRCTAKLSKMTWRWLMLYQLTSILWQQLSVSMPIETNLRHLWHCVV